MSQTVNDVLFHLMRSLEISQSQGGLIQRINSVIKDSFSLSWLLLSSASLTHWLTSLGFCPFVNVIHSCTPKNHIFKV